MRQPIGSLAESLLAVNRYSAAADPNQVMRGALSLVAQLFGRPSTSQCSRDSGPDKEPDKSIGNSAQLRGPRESRTSGQTSHC